MKMQVLIKDGAEVANEKTILVFPQLGGSDFETLAGEKISGAKGILAEADSAAVTKAINDGAKERNDEFATAKDLQADVMWLHKKLGHFELGSKFGLELKGATPHLDLSDAIKIDRAAGLGKGHRVAIGPTISPRTYMNARGTVVAVEGKQVTISLDAGDRDRIKRATGKEVADPSQFPLGCVEILDGDS